MGRGGVLTTAFEEEEEEEDDTERRHRRIRRVILDMGFVGALGLGWVVVSC